MEHDFKNCRYDYIVFADVIEHLPDPEIMIKRAMTLLVEGGCLLITTPAKIENYQWDKHYIKEYTPGKLSEFLGKFSNQVTIQQFMPLKSYRSLQQHRRIFNLIDYVVNPLKLNGPFSNHCMIFAVVKR